MGQKRKAAEERAILLLTTETICGEHSPLQPKDIKDTNKQQKHPKTKDSTASIQVVSKRRVI